MVVYYGGFNQQNIELQEIIVYLITVIIIVVCYISFSGCSISQVAATKVTVGSIVY